MNQRNRLASVEIGGFPSSKVLARFMESIRTFQFHDTSDTAKIRLDGYAGDDR
jgi:hypothetical protein